MSAKVWQEIIDKKVMNKSGYCCLGCKYL